ncbi:metabolite traffic protein EboE [Limnoraphis robusta Tam1]|uniref:metabolite traffic protein EboE n=1 Tax=Limnoraphis robusta TaxID=1118279 RepID=UPI002B21F507|nr:metabolite traffic protein EboE [Limnoraphis robusta]MEA5497943.1 metabolite traffic protein EboE [Limnoraphis robusta BA-68 BA1]MEA5542951.1 metabolite traffic protein EboE [Limnoraphis robusta Tam1]
MQLTENGAHLTYCTNIHPGESWLEVLTNLKQYLPALKSRFNTEYFGIGLRLSHQATIQLQAAEIAEFKAWLVEQGLYVFTLNGFPYGGFHNEVVKDKVYAPDWTTPERTNYTKNLAHILAELLPEGVKGSISTLPLSYKPWFNSSSNINQVFKQSTINLVEVVIFLVNLHQTRGKFIHIDLEPEPNGLIENSAEVIKFFENWLLPLGGKYLANKLNLSLNAAETLLREHIQICYDTCHFSVVYENPVQVFRDFKQAGISIGKIQISAAIKNKLPQEKSERANLAESLQKFAESTYLHQVVAAYADGTLQSYIDLPEALEDLKETTAQEWRTHFHIPIFNQTYGILQSTQDDILTVLNLLKSYPCEHLEIETYTFQVLPENLKTDLLTSIQREYDWVIQQDVENFNLYSSQFKKPLLKIP